jgi:signal transduction histidine kinase
VQESLNNVFKHASATSVKIHLHSISQITERVEIQPSEVELIISDNGCGFNPAKGSFDHFGLKFMIERAEAIGAKMKIESKIGSGTRISVVLANAGG